VSRSVPEAAVRVAVVLAAVEGAQAAAPLAEREAEAAGEQVVVRAAGPVERVALAAEGAQAGPVAPVEERAAEAVVARAAGLAERGEATTTILTRIH
jgi:hypothetical protein